MTQGPVRDIWQDSIMNDVFIFTAAPVSPSPAPSPPEVYIRRDIHCLRSTERIGKVA